MAEPARATQDQVTQLLAAAGEGDSRAASDLLPLVYEELRRLARSQMKKEASGRTLQATALVHEAYLRLVGVTDLKWENRGHFFGAAARAMRRILVDEARKRGRQKRGGEFDRIELDQADAPAPGKTDLMGLDDALDRLERDDARKAEIVMLRYFAGLSIEETAAALGLSTATVKKEWAFARAWLKRELERSAAGGAE